MEKLARSGSFCGLRSGIRMSSMPGAMIQPESWHHRVPRGCRHASRKLTRRTHGSRMTNTTRRTILSDLAECFEVYFSVM